MNYVLCGFMGCGKTSIGKKVAQLSGYKFYDMDKLIQQSEKMTITEIFEKKGEPYFRKLETNTLENLLKNKKSIIATGGGALVNPINVELVRRCHATILFLDVPLAAIQERLKTDKKRPLLKRPDRREFIEKLYNQRYATYKSAADTVVSAGAPTITVAKKIFSIIEENNHD